MNTEVQNPNDFKVVSFHNPTTYAFTPEMGCMYDSKPIHGKDGIPGIAPGETIILPYHVGQQLAKNLAKRILNTSPAASVDPAGIPTGVPIWSEARLEEEKNKLIKDLYTEEKPVQQSETDKLMAKVDEYKSLVEKLMAGEITSIKQEEIIKDELSAKTTFVDKQEVIQELEKREIKHDKRQSKESLEKLLV